MEHVDPGLSLPGPPGVWAADGSVLSCPSIPLPKVKSLSGAAVSWGSTKPSPLACIWDISEGPSQLQSSLYDCLLWQLDGRLTSPTAQSCCPHSYPGCFQEHPLSKGNFLHSSLCFSLFLGKPSPKEGYFK